MTMQYHYEGEEGWTDIEEGEAYRFNSMKWVIFREKPSFEPGYYRQIAQYGINIGSTKVIEQGFVQWWTYEPDMKCWERVEVTPVD